MFIPPGKGARHVLRVIREILSFRPRRTKTDIAGALDYLGRVQSRRAVVFVISDFQAEGFEKSLRVLGRRHDVIAVSISDSKESSLPALGMIELEDAETGETVLIDTGKPDIRKRYEMLCLARDRGLSELLRSVGIDRIRVEAGRTYIRDMMAFFKNREKRR